MLDDPTGYGRVVRDADGAVERIVETKSAGDATPEELAIREINTGIYAFDARRAARRARPVGTDNAQGELYLADVLPLLREAGRTVAAHLVDDPALALGVNDRADLARSARIAQRRILERHMRAGRDDRRPGSTRSTPTSRSARTRRSSPVTLLRGATRSAPAATIGPHTTLIDARLGDGVTVLHSYLDDLRGPRRRHASARSPTCAPAPCCARARRSARSSRSRTPTSARARRSRTSPTSATPTSGEGTNLGAGTITANYDGRSKHRTTIGDAACTAASTRRFVAPVTRRRRRLHWRRVGDHRGRARRRARHRAGAPEERRGLRRRARSRTSREHRSSLEPRRALPAMTPPSRTRRRARASRSATTSGSCSFAGRANPRARRQDRRQAGRRPRRRSAQDLLQRRGLLPLRGVDPRRRPLHRPVDLRQPAARASPPTTR